MLALRKFGYPMHGKPDDMELEEIILNDMGTSDPSILYKTIRSWEQVHTEGTKLRKRNDMSRVSYQQWVIERVKIVKFPFFIEVPPRSASPEPYPFLLRKWKSLEPQWIGLKNKRKNYNPTSTRKPEKNGS